MEAGAGIHSALHISIILKQCLLHQIGMLVPLAGLAVCL